MKKATSLAILSFLSLAAPLSAAHYQVYLLGGQSNGNGRADAAQLTTPLDAAQTDVRFYWHRTQSVSNVGHLVEGRWIDLAPGSGHGSGAPVYAKEFGCEVSFGRSMADAKPSENIAIIKYTVGGSNLHTQWSATGPLYSTFVSTVQTALAALTTNGHTYELKGMLWHQGESDTSGTNADNYETNLTNLIARIRADLFASGPLPFMIGTISDSQYSNITTAGTGPYKVRQAQEAVAAADPNTGIVITDGYSTRPSDSIHFDHTGQIAMGQSFATQIILLEGPDVTAPQLQSTSPADDASNASTNAALVATFNEPIALMNGGTVTIRNLGPGPDIVITLPDSQVFVSGTSLIIDPTADLVLENPYAIQISANAITDLASPANVFNGISDDTTWNFTTVMPGNITNIFDENSAATNELDLEVTPNTLAPFKAAVVSAYANGLGGVIDWETGFTTTPSSGGTARNTLISVDATYAVGTASIVTVTFNHSMDLYTNDIAEQVNVLSQDGTSRNALIAGGGNEPVGLEYTMTFPGASVTEIGVAMPSRSTYGTGVDFRATATFSGGTSEILEFLIGGTPGSGDTFLHFAAPGSETITSVSVEYLDDNGQGLTNGQRRPTLDDLGFILISEPLPGDGIGTTGLFDEGIDATNQIDVEVSPGTLETFKAEVLNAYHNDRGGVIDWETGIVTNASTTSSSNNLISIANATFGTSGGNTLTATFGRPMELYTNNVNSQINVLSQEGSRQNAVIPQGVASNALEYTITFSGADIGKLGAAMPSRSTYGTGVDFRATATFSGGSSEILEFTIGGTPGTGDTFLYFSAPGSESITSLTVAFLDDNGQSLTDGQRRPTLDDLGFILASPANSFAAWVGDPAFGLDPNDQGFGDDPDGDGIPNSLEAWFGTNPGEFSKGLTPGVVTSNTFTFSHPQNANPLNDISASYQWSKDLVTFNPDEAADGDGTTVDFSPETNEGITTVTATVSGTAVSNLFVRVAAVQVP